jgi:hypothetical protein
LTACHFVARRWRDAVQELFDLPISWMNQSDAG